MRPPPPTEGSDVALQLIRVSKVEPEEKKTRTYQIRDR